MTTIRLFADDQKLNVVVGPKIASGDQLSVEVRATFSANWNDYEKSAVFYTSWDSTVYEMLLFEDKCVVPHEVLSKSGYLFIGIRGVKPDTQAVKTSSLVKYRLDKGAPCCGTTVDPTPDVYQQILAKLDEMSVGGSGGNGAPGKDGVSATHRWNGTVLTITSASGSSSADLKGPKGDPGKDGQDGYTPVKGVDYHDGEPGKDGVDGKPGKDYVLTEADKTEIAEQAAQMVEVPDVEIPTKLPNPHALTINGTSYDGSEAVDLTAQVNALINTKLGVIENGTY